jgi:peptidase A4-like protein
MAMPVRLRTPAAVRLARALAAAVALSVAAVAAVEAASPPSAGGATQRRYAVRAAAETSSNWAGYSAVTPDGAAASTFTSATGTWKQPGADCSLDSAGSASAVWVGLGGYDLNAPALEQIGTDADCNNSGKPVYYAWYELVPAPPVNLKFAIRPGDTLTASVNFTEGIVWLQLKNRTTGAVFNKKVSVASPDLTSADWIVEAPSSCSRFACRPVPLTNFGSVTISKIATIADAHPGTLTDTAWRAAQIQLVPHSGNGFFPGDERGVNQTSSTAGTTKPVPTTDGRGFTVAWAATATPAG